MGDNAPGGIYDQIVTSKRMGQKKFAVLIDPDKLRLQNMDEIIHLAIEAQVDYFFLGGSLIVNDMLDNCLMQIKAATNIPLILFPGNSYQISYKADAILFLSLISGRNAELLIGKHVITAPFLRISPLEVISTGYILVDGGVPTTVSYMSNTQPIPADKEDIAMCTALAGELLGLKMNYLDAGSGAANPVSESMIDHVASSTSTPLIVGGGVKTPEKAFANMRAGADILVVGNAIEKDPSMIREISAAVHQVSSIR